VTEERRRITRSLVRELRISEDWVTLAAAVGLFGISSFTARSADLKPILECVNGNPAMHLISAHLGYRRMQKPIPIEPLLNEIFAKPESSDRAAAMMEYLVEIDDELAFDPYD